jgi:tetratricopeptide (TPR) repeat protein
MTRILRLAILLMACAILPVATTGCGSTVADWIVRTRNHQGDVALEHKNFPDASVAYELALQIDPTNVHARTGLVNVQIRIADTLFAASKFDQAIDALAKASKYSPHDDRVAGLRAVIEQAEIKRDIVVSNYPLYKVSGRGLRRAYAQLAAQNAQILAALQKFDYTYDTADLGDAIKQSYALNEEVTRLTSRLTQYRQLVESGIPEHGAENLVPPASLLPLP